MLVDLVQVMTRDGVRLDGSLQVPLPGIATQLPVDAFLLVHGTGGSFYSSTLFDSFAERFLQLGCAVLRVNTRGHDGISTAVTTQGGRRLGAAYEVVDDCRHDLAAWIDWLAARNYPRIGLLGHSLGAVKCIYALAHEPHPAVARLVALSPPRLSYSHFQSGPKATEFSHTYAASEQHVRSGRPDALLDVKFPLPFVITAAGYLEKYGPDERYNFLGFIPRLPCPALMMFGTIELEGNVAFAGLPEALAPIAARSENIAVEVVPGADHFYTGVRSLAVEEVVRWLEQSRSVNPTN